MAEGLSRDEAERIAVQAVGGGRATWSGPEDDLGAAWEIEVTRPDGSEVDVLVGEDGSVIDMLERSGATGGSGPQPAESGVHEGVIDRAAAEQIALEAVGGGQVTWTGREDDLGAAWEIEVTRPDGSEVDVLVDAFGNVVHASG